MNEELLAQIQQDPFSYVVKYSILGWTVSKEGDEYSISISEDEAAMIIAFIKQAFESE